MKVIIVNKINLISIFAASLITICLPAKSQSTTDTTRYALQGKFVFDKQTKLTWARCSVGQQWCFKKGCKGNPKGFTFATAQKLTTAYRRVPTKDELDTLFSAFDAPVKIDTAIFPMRAGSNGQHLYWSSEQFDDSSAWYADFNLGATDHIFGDYSFLNEKFFVRLVKVDRVNP